MNHARPQAFSDLLRPVVAAVVGDDDFSAEAVARDGELRLLDAAPDRRRFVQARHDDRQLDAVRIGDDVAHFGRHDDSPR